MPSEEIVQIFLKVYTLFFCPVFQDDTYYCEPRVLADSFAHFLPKSLENTGASDHHTWF